MQRLQDHGILGPKTILGHCIHVNTAEMDIIQATDTMCVNNPESNMGNAVGCSPVLQLYKQGILVGLGTDAYTNDMLESIKVALIIQRHNACLPNVGWCEVTDMLFKNNAKMAPAYRLPHPGRPGSRRRRRRDRHGLQALHPLLRCQHRRPHALRHDRPPVPDHHDQRQDPDAVTASSRRSTKRPSTPIFWRAASACGASSTTASIEPLPYCLPHL